MIVVIGCGNSNRSDDGAGIAVVRDLQARGLAAENVRLFDAGTDGMSVMFAARGCTTLIVVDACRSGADPGAIFEVPGDKLDREPERSFSLHDFRWDHALYAGKKIFGAQFPTDVTVLLIEARSIELGIGLSPEVVVSTVKVADRVAAIVQSRLAP